MLKNKILGLALGVSPVAVAVLPHMASAQVDVTGITSGIASGTVAAVSVVGSYGTNGILLTVALIAGAIVVALIWMGARKGKKVVSGKI